MLTKNSIFKWTIR